MASSVTPCRIEWKTSSLDIVLVEDKHGCICIQSLSPHGTNPPEAAGHVLNETHLPLISIHLAGEGNMDLKTAKSLTGSQASTRFKYQSHEVRTHKDSIELVIHTLDPKTFLQASAHLSVFNTIPVLRSYVKIMNQSSSHSSIITQLSSLTVGGLSKSSMNWYNDYSLLTATNSWFREAQWREQSLPDVGLDNNGILELGQGHSASQAAFTLSSRGSFSTGTHLPMGVLQRTDASETWIWQIEHNGSWRWEIGDYKDSIYLAAGGPTGADHNWKIHLRPGESFASVPVACCRVTGGFDTAMAALTDYRRAIRRPHTDHERMPIIFNDYMNCLMGDPDEEKIAALLEPVAKSGAEYFVIDAGWYADDSGWWDDVGLWQPSEKRFPSGFKTLLDKIRANGLIPGLWIEPEVVGVRSVVANRLPEEAFFHEDGQRVQEKGRYQLDYRHAEVIKWMNSVIERLVTAYGAGYLKFDYNIDVVQGTDTNTSSPGAAHLEHQRAYLAWVRSLLDRYPDLVIENCSSGAQRMEYAMLSVHPLQSTSDQQNPLLYAAIAAAVPTAVVPEQSATWAYPQPSWDDEINCMTVVNSLLGRVHLSGRLDQLSEAQLNLVIDGMNVYQSIRHHLALAHPIWPSGLPKWHDDFISLGMICPGNIVLLSVWRRAGPTEHTISLPFLSPGKKEFKDTVQVKLLYPKFELDYSWCTESSSLHLRLPKRPCARLLQLQLPMA